MSTSSPTLGWIVLKLSSCRRLQPGGISSTGGTIASTLLHVAVLRGCVCSKSNSLIANFSCSSPSFRKIHTSYVTIQPWIGSQWSCSVSEAYSQSYLTSWRRFLGQDRHSRPVLQKLSTKTEKQKNKNEETPQQLRCKLEYHTLEVLEVSQKIPCSAQHS